MNNDLISRGEAEKLGATCLARRNENGQLEAIISLDNAPTVDKKYKKEEIEYAIESSDCTLHAGKTYYEKEDLMRSMENLGLFEDEE